jgi:hypothetical protein
LTLALPVGRVFEEKYFCKAPTITVLSISAAEEQRLGLKIVVLTEEGRGRMILSGCVACSSGIYIADQFFELFSLWKNLPLIFQWFSDGAYLL